MNFFAMNETPDGKIIIAAGFELIAPDALHEVESLLRILSGWTPDSSETRGIIEGQIAAVQSRIARRAMTQAETPVQGDSQETK